MTAHSKHATKFVVRFDDDVMHGEAKDRAKAEHIALNSFILQAIEEKLQRGKAIDKLIELAGLAVGEHPQVVLSLSEKREPVVNA